MTATDTSYKQNSHIAPHCILRDSIYDKYDLCDLCGPSSVFFYLFCQTDQNNLSITQASLFALIHLNYKQ